MLRIKPSRNSQLGALTPGTNQGLHSSFRGWQCSRSTHTARSHLWHQSPLTMAAPHSWGTAALGTRHGRGAHTASLFILFKTAEADLGALYFRFLEMCMILKHCNSIFFYHLSRTSFEKINFLEVFSKHEFHWGTCASRDHFLSLFQGAEILLDPILPSAAPCSAPLHGERLINHLHGEQESQMSQRYPKAAAQTVGFCDYLCLLPSPHNLSGSAKE